MDLRLVARVLWRFRLLVLGGCCVALALTFLSVVRVDPGGSPVFSYRKSETWIGVSRLFVTEPGFPWGRRLILPADSTTPDSPTKSDPSRFTGLAILYSTFADSDPVRRIRLKNGPFKARVTAAPMASIADGDPLPIIELTATGVSKQAAISNTRRASNALVQYIRQEQVANRIPDDDRVLLQPIETPTPKTAKLLAGRPKVTPLVVFVGVMALVIGLALLLENLRPRSTPTELRAEAELEAELPTSPRIRVEPEPEQEPPTSTTIRAEPEPEPEPESKPAARLRRPA